MKSKRAILFFLLLPGAVFILLFTALPFYYMIERSLHKSNYIINVFVGIGNYIKTFKDPGYREVIGTSFMYAGIICFFSTFIPLIFALMVYDTPKWVQNYTRFMFFVPGFASGVIISQVWRWIYQPRVGLINYLLSFLNIEPIMWMGGRYTAIIGISLMTILGNMGVPILVYLSNILSINPELYDAARIDGATKLQIKIKIVIPLLLPSILLVVLITMATGFFMLGTILMMTGGGYGTSNFMYNIYSEGALKRSVGMASARSAILVVIVLGMAILKRKLEEMKR